MTTSANALRRGKARHAYLQKALYNGRLDYVPSLKRLIVDQLNLSMSPPPQCFSELPFWPSKKRTRPPVYSRSDFLFFQPHQYILLLEYKTSTRSELPAAIRESAVAQLARCRRDLLDTLDRHGKAFALPIRLKVYCVLVVKYFGSSSKRGTDESYLLSTDVDVRANARYDSLFRQLQVQDKMYWHRRRRRRRRRQYKSVRRRQGDTSPS